MKYFIRTGRLCFVTVILTITAPASGEVFYSKQEAMELAFGKDKSVELLSLFPDEQQTVKIEQLAKSKLESAMFTFYVGKNKDTILGYAAIESITVRTKPETLMVVLTPTGELRDVYTLAFHEPPEYMPPERWFEQLRNRPLDELVVGRGVDGISGATLSTRAGINSARKVLAMFQVMIKEKSQ